MENELSNVANTAKHESKESTHSDFSTHNGILAESGRVSSSSSNAEHSNNVADKSTDSKKTLTLNDINFKNEIWSDAERFGTPGARHARFREAMQHDKALVSRNLLPELDLSGAKEGDKGLRITHSDHSGIGLSQLRYELNRDEHQSEVREQVTKDTTLPPLKQGEGYYQVLERVHPEWSEEELAKEANRIKYEVYNGRTELRVGEELRTVTPEQEKEHVKAQMDEYDKTHPKPSPEPLKPVPPKPELPIVPVPKPDVPVVPAPKPDVPVVPAPKPDAPVAPAPKPDAPVAPAPKPDAPAGLSPFADRIKVGALDPVTHLPTTITIDGTPKMSFQHLDGNVSNNHSNSYVGSDHKYYRISFDDKSGSMKAVEVANPSADANESGITRTWLKNGNEVTSNTVDGSSSIEIKTPDGKIQTSATLGGENKDELEQLTVQSIDGSPLNLQHHWYGGTFHDDQGNEYKAQVGNDGTTNYTRLNQDGEPVESTTVYPDGSTKVISCGSDGKPDLATKVKVGGKVYAMTVDGHWEDALTHNPVDVRIHGNQIVVKPESK